MIPEEFLKQIKKESADIEALTKRNYFIHLSKLFKMIAYDGDRLNKKHNLMITPYLQYLSNTARNDFREDMSQPEIDELLESIKTELDCIIFRMSPTIS
ncbi:hypothetical protein [Mucilaginibacter ginsenosidivorax]|uniref:Uncharacterized protein n=1 Tax=Mucilaginibacter ginsenosidivorax TaxID=862126 RepID=A0A5B8W5K0_9SPHI|nr:hypothetical protein [Mucilaginibacter ginsenosidivorax]QEC79073.1 hypothetical protein FSB76_25125 [Mucilaginibacter ginsenosidivorax]